MIFAQLIYCYKIVILFSALELKFYTQRKLDPYNKWTVDHYPGILDTSINRLLELQIYIQDKINR